MDQERGTRHNPEDKHGRDGLALAGVQALVVGLAREGTALARFLVKHGARVTVTDARRAEALGDRLEALAGLEVSYALGGHPASLLDQAEIVFVSPGVPLEIPLLVEARRRGLPLSSETRLSTRLCPAPITAITGSSGKTTTTALVGRMMEAAGRRTWVGGNIGQPFIGHLETMKPDDAVVMELSSFQLEFFAPWPAGQRSKKANPLFDPAGWSPHLAGVLNITPNHLDRHGTMEAYIAAKAHILAHQQPGDIAVLGLDNPIARALGREAQGQVLWFSMVEEVDEGAFLRGGELILRLAGKESIICRREALQLLGKHNVANALAACTLAGASGAPVQAISQVATSFAGVEHRLELIRELDGTRWYNDSIATTPERTVAALRAFDTPIVLLAGGRDKHLPWDEMATLTWQKVRHLILFGEAADLIKTAMEATGPGSTTIHQASDLPGAVACAAALVRPGDVVLLSPGGTSYDAYLDFVARGNHFRQLVSALE